MRAYTETQLDENERMLAAEHGIPASSFDRLLALRARIATSGMSDSHKTAVWIVAPVLAGFSQALAEKTRSDNMIVFGVMREGRLLCQLMKRLFNIDAREADFNRHFCMLAAYDCGDEDALLNWLVRSRTQPLTHAQLGQIFPGHVAPTAEAHRPIDAAEAQKLIDQWRAMGADAPSHPVVKAAHEKVWRYWRRLTESCGERPIAFMDFACAGNIQRSLHIMLQHHKEKTRLVGLNFLTTRGSMWAKAKGCVLHGYLAEDGKPAWIADAYARAPEVMEMFTAAPLGPLIDYDSEGRPLRGASGLSQQQIVTVGAWQKNIVAAAALFHDEMGTHLTPELCRCLWGRLLLRPLPAEVMALADWPVDSGLGLPASRTLAPKLTGNPEDWSKVQSGWPAASLLRQNLPI